MRVLALRALEMVVVVLRVLVQLLVVLMAMLRVPPTHCL